MMHKLILRGTGVALALGLLAGTLLAEDAPPPAAAPAPAAESKAPPEPCRRNAVPCVASWAVPSFNDKECGYYIGGGCAFRGCSDPGTGMGTWGWDYLGCIPRKIVLKYCPNCRYQGGTGAYQTQREKGKLLHALHAGKEEGEQ